MLCLIFVCVFDILIVLFSLLIFVVQAYYCMVLRVLVSYFWGEFIV